jgi:hypothetical protein
LAQLGKWFSFFFLLPHHHYRGCLGRSIGKQTGQGCRYPSTRTDTVENTGRPAVGGCHVETLVPLPPKSINTPSASDGPNRGPRNRATQHDVVHAARDARVLIWTAKAASPNAPEVAIREAV